ncbi:Phosphatidate cytidylyltransferase CdsA [Helicobacter ailurogastricus]|uniref:Phosphatidate cytidylyltransferase n=2 Tax=Helicobacter ailurogastricus TaxID=1578720 RepID=A0A0K2XFI5_9HELI|nr:Phosphatidate cytidylyltransferase [Helicobacter ailurogastricus]CRF43104.1 Phosphatidate cytidylyltransferase [Helicobacter ailurogastricus]CRF44333.1 Phosphatidate cytidylyltransferase [Helicobacter ailurogastricus]GLH57396.1 Phosphatidate cytidylyltransferase CdsA [Helicobacter ailurogastricus]GLH58768.1 Phosphatidate cytidylyltransferase CdsA [Helicobacter ailurogastricus]
MNKMETKKLSGEKTRYITGGFLVVLAVTVFYLNSLWVFWAVLGVLYMLGGHEVLQMYQKIYGPAPNAWHYVGMFVLWILIYILPSIEVVLFLGMFVAGYLAYKALDVRHSLFFVYPTLNFACFLALFKDFGVMAVVWLVVVAMSADVGAYFGGRLFGYIPLSPTSPKKTFEGAFVGLMFASIAGGLVGLKYVGFLYAFVISVIIALSAILGDLYESSLKRRADIKDSGNILPGHGGVLDRLDAMLFGAVSMHFLLHTKEVLEAHL